MNCKTWLTCLLLPGAMAVTAQNTLKVQSGVTLTTTGAAVITLQDMNLENDGTISQGTGAGTFRFTGTADNTIAGVSAPLFDILEIAKTGTAKVSLQQNINVGSGITFTSGLIDLNNNNILMHPAALLLGESEASRIIGPAGGYIEITNTLNAPSGVNPGNLGAIITSAANMDNTTVRRGHRSQVNGFGMGNSILRYYDIIPASNTSLNATLRFKYFDAEMNGLNESTVIMWKSDDSLHWSSQSFTSRDIAANYVEKTGIADFSRWTLSSLNNALPVQFSLFNVRCDGVRILVNWKTAQELNTDRFEIQRSVNGANWTTIGTLPAAGNSSIEKSYSFADNNPLPAIALYRVAEYVVDGQVHYTSVIRSDCDKMDTWRVWPNPVQEQLFVNVSAANSSAAMIRIYDAKGALVREQSNVLMPGNNQLNVDMRRLSGGTYHVVVAWENGQQQKAVKVIKQ